MARYTHDESLCLHYDSSLDTGILQKKRRKQSNVIIDPRKKVFENDG